MISKTKTFLSALTAVAALAAFSPAQAGVPESKDPIKLAVNEWTGQHLSTYIYGALLEGMGYNVEYVTAGAVPVCGPGNGQSDGQPRELGQQCRRDLSQGSGQR
jgi:ABC-type proline/glycine betaine transport system substrate-binding protein